MRLRKIMALAMLALIVFPSFGIMVGAASLTVGTDSASYAPGEEVEIHGTAEPDANVTIIVIVNSTLETIHNVTISADEDGEYSTRVSLSTEASEGLYNVTASAGDAPAQTSFIVTLSDTIDEEDMVEEEMSEEATSEEEETVEAAAERAIGLKEAIKRAYLFIEKIKAARARLEERDFEVQDIDEYLTDAEDLLDEATTYLDPESFDVDDAAQKLAKARGILGRTMGLLHSTARKEVKAMKAERFLEHLESRIQSLEEKINRLQKHLTKGQGVLTALHITKMKLLRIREHLAAGNVEDAIDDLEDAVEEIDGEVDELNGRGTSIFIRAMNRLEAKIRVLNATAERLAKKGADTSEIMEELTNTEALLGEMMNRLAEGDTDEAEELLEEAEEHLEEIQEAARIIQRSKIVGKAKTWVEKVKKWRPEEDEEN